MEFRTTLKKIENDGWTFELYTSREQDEKKREYRENYFIDAYNDESGEEAEFGIEDYDYEFGSFYYKDFFGNEHEDWLEQDGLFDREFTELIAARRSQEVEVYNTLTAEGAEEAWRSLVNGQLTGWSEQQVKLEGAMRKLGFSAYDDQPVGVAEAVESLKKYGVK